MSNNIESKKYKIDLKKYTGVHELIPISEDAIRNGNVIEAFGILHGVLEMQLSTLWAFFLISRGFGKKFDPMRGGDESAKIFDFNHYVEMLYQTDVIDNKIKSSLKNFNDGRNDVMHNLVHLLKRKGRINESMIQIKFKAGLRASKILQEIIEQQIKTIATHFKAH